MNAPAPVSTETFDPVAFLALKSEVGANPQQWQALLWKDLGAFMLEQFVNSLNDDELDEVAGVLPHIPDYTIALRLIKHYRPNFDELKPTYLSIYKNRFNLDNFKAKYHL